LFSIREGRDEGQIGPIKKVLVSMRRDPVYRETKMRLIHKLDGIEFLKSSTDDSPPSERHSYKGYHVYGSRQEVTTRLQGSKPISCFRRGNSGADEVHVAFSEKEKRGETVSYLTLTYDTSDAVTDTGVYFSRFILKTKENSQYEPDVSRVTKEDLRSDASAYALMLPYLAPIDTDSFEKFTLVYHDWEVLLCNPMGAGSKGRPAIHWDVFEGM